MRRNEPWKIKQVPKTDGIDCAEEICVNNCDRKAECDPGGYGSDFVQKTTCPLNVCCSKYGFCGTTAEFCGSKTVSRPSCDVSQGSRFKRVVGYYESWAPSRVCNRFYPEQIPSGVYSHIIFAFASIDPKTFRLVPARQVDVDLYERVANLKRKDPNLKVLIAVGGWTFNDPGPRPPRFPTLPPTSTASASSSTPCCGSCRLTTLTASTSTGSIRRPTTAAAARKTMKTFPSSWPLSSRP